MAVVGCYSLDLYCDTGGEPYGDNCPEVAQGQFTGRTEGDCIRAARSDGWTFNREKTQAFCPKCSKGLKPAKRSPNTSVAT